LFDFDEEKTTVYFIRSMDKDKRGKISEKTFRKIMIGKDDISAKDIEEMLDEYYRYVLL